MNLKLSSFLLSATTILTLVLPAYAGVSNLSTSGNSSTVNQFTRLVPEAEPAPELVAQASPAVTFPLEAEREDDVWKGGKGKMRTWFSLDSSGNLRAGTKTWNDSKFAGFTGGVYIVFTDASGSPIWNTEQQRYGVDGKKIGNSDRTVEWQATVPPDILNKIEGYAIKHEHTPTGRVFEYLSSEEGQRMIKSIFVLIRSL